MNFHKFSALFLFLSLMTGCSVVDRFHGDIDRSLDGHHQPRQGTTNLDNLRSQANGGQQQGQLSSMEANQVLPETKRNYQEMRKRIVPADLNDSGSDGSLWADSGKTQYLFNLKEKKKLGDIVLLNVLDDLKKEISLELTRSFPEKTLPTNSNSKTASATKAPATEESVKPAAESDQTVIYDKISTVLIEEVNTEHVLLRGKKNLLFKGQKRDVEIQALVRKDSITETDTVDSDKVIESNIRVLR